MLCVTVHLREIILFSLPVLHLNASRSCLASCSAPSKRWMVATLKRSCTICFVCLVLHLNSSHLGTNIRLFRARMYVWVCARIHSHTHTHTITLKRLKYMCILFILVLCEERVARVKSHWFVDCRWAWGRRWSLWTRTCTADTSARRPERWWRRPSSTTTSSSGAGWRRKSTATSTWRRCWSTTSTPSTTPTVRSANRRSRTFDPRAEHVLAERQVLEPQSSPRRASNTLHWHGAGCFKNTSHR